MFKKSDFIIVMATMPSRDKKLLEALENSDGTIIYLNAIEDKEMLDISSISSRYECGSEEGVLAILAKEILNDKDIPLHVKKFFEDLDEGYISAECNVGEEEIEEINNLCKLSKTPYLYIGSDINNHPRNSNIKKIISLFKEFGGFDTNISYSKTEDLEGVEELESFDGSIVYFCESIDNSETKQLIGSAQFAIGAKIHDKENIQIITDNNSYNRIFKLDIDLKGTIALLPGEKCDSYSYKTAKIMKEDMQ